MGTLLARAEVHSRNHGKKHYMTNCLPLPIFDQMHGSSHCIDMEGVTWTIDFTPMDFSNKWTRVGDGTVLCLMDSQYLIRFRLNLTSPFFLERSEIVELSAYLLDELGSLDDPVLSRLPIKY